MKLLTYEALFEIGDTVYIKTDPDQKARMVTGHKIRKTALIYLVSFISTEDEYADFELTGEEDKVKRFTANND